MRKKQHPLMVAGVITGLWLMVSALIYGFMSGAIVNALGQTLTQSLIYGAIVLFVFAGLAINAAEKK